MLLAGAAMLTTAGLARTHKEGGTFRIATTPIDSIDPAITYGPSVDFLDASCAKLFRGADVPGHAAYRIVPEASAAFPKVSAAGA